MGLAQSSPSATVAVAFTMSTWALSMGALYSTKLENCRDVPNCVHFTFLLDTGFCMKYEMCPEFSTTARIYCISGEYLAFVVQMYCLYSTRLILRIIWMSQAVFN